MPLQLHDVPRFLSLRVPASNHPDFLVGNMGGKLILLHFAAGSLSSEAGQTHADRLMRLTDPWNQSHALITAIVTPDGADCPVPAKRWPTSPAVFFYDQAGEMAHTFEVPETAQGTRLPTTYLLNNRSQVIASIIHPDPEVHLATLADWLPKLAPVLSAVSPAPVLVLPGVFDPSLCDELIDGFERDNREPSGYMVEVGGKTVGQIDPDRKQRRDWVISDPTLERRLLAAVQRRVMPEVEKAFQFNITRMERYLVARYDAGAGHFKAHRDNTTGGTAHRCFAMSVHLNDDYEGGGVSFPEYNPQGYKTGKGGAVVFSCTLMHEALPVTRGSRYVFLPFFYDEAAAQLRERNNHLLGEGMMPYRRLTPAPAAAPEPVESGV